MNHTARFVLTERDVALIQLVFAYGGVTADHLLTRFFPTPGARSACYRRIAQLIDAEYLRSQRLPPEAAFGSGKAFLTVGPKARAVLAKHLNCSAASLRRATRMQMPRQIHHHLATCDVQLAVELAAAESPAITDHEWTPVWELGRRPLKVTDPATSETITLIADGAFTLALADGSEGSFLVEIDRDTMTNRKRMRSRLRGYLLASMKTPLAVLWVTISRARADALASLALDEAKRLKADATIFWITLQSDVTEKTVLTESIWQVVGGPAKVSLLGSAPVPALPAAPPLLVAQGVSV